MTYIQAVEWAENLTRLHTATGTQTMRKLMNALGNPQQKLKFVHIAGTNGKGTALAMTASILKEAGYKTGANISPYIIDFRERFQINGEMISEECLADILNRVRNAAEKEQLSILGFEAVTAAALVYFAQEQCDIVCLEAGIGGQKDATNIIENTLVAYIMRVGFDHTEILGDTLAKITEDKCGILKNNCEVISYPEQLPEVVGVIKEKAKKLGCHLLLPDMEDFAFPEKPNPYKNKIDYGGYKIVVPFLGRHQALNAAVAIEGALALWRKGFAIEDEHIIAGIEKTKFPARIELIPSNPIVIIDGAHNEDSARALAATLCAAKLENLTAIVGVMQDKQAEAIIGLVAPYIGSLYAVEAKTPRSMQAEAVADIARKYLKNAFVCDDISAAIELAKEEERPILVFGSFYVASEVRSLLKKEDK